MLDSEVALPALLPEKRSSPDIRLTLAPESGSSYTDFRWDHHWCGPAGGIVLSSGGDGDGYRLGIPGMAVFVIGDGGSRITCHPRAGLAEETLQHLVVDQVLPRLLSLRGFPVLHAGCVASPSGAVAFLGESGAGKSTLCAALVRAGRRLVSDDAVLVRPEGTGGFEALPSYPSLRLAPDTMRCLSGTSDAAPVAHYSSKRRLGGIPIALGSSPLRVLYVLGRSEEGGEVRIDAVKGREAFLHLVRATFQFHRNRPDRARTLFRRLGELAEGLPMRRLAYPRRFEALPTVVAALEEDGGS